MKILVAYITKTGTTREVAEKLASVLASRGHAAKTVSLENATDLSAYDMVVLGSPINAMRLLPEFKAFTAQHASQLSGKKVALFAVSYLHAYGRAMWTKLIEREIAKTAASVGAKTSVIFGGRLGSGPTGGMAFMFGTPKDPVLDRRDWPAIEAWAQALSAL